MCCSILTEMTLDLREMHLTIFWKKEFKVFCGVWASADYLDVQSNYVHETRRGVDGYNLYYNEDSYKQFFNLSEILESSRPSWGE